MLIKNYQFLKTYIKLLLKKKDYITKATSLSFSLSHFFFLNYALYAFFSGKNKE